jgi:hypothetical protein
MSKHPPSNDEQYNADLTAIENAMNNMMQGAFSMMFKQLTDSNIFESVEFPGVMDDSNSPNVTTTILNGNNLNSSTSINEEDGYGGNDFKRLAKKSKQNRGIIPAEDIVSNKPQYSQQQQQAPSSPIATSAGPPAGSIFNLLFQQPAAGLFNRGLPDVHPAEASTGINSTSEWNNDEVRSCLIKSYRF